MNISYKICGKPCKVELDNYETQVLEKDSSRYAKRKIFMHAFLRKNLQEQLPRS